MTFTCPDDLRHEFAETFAQHWLREVEPTLPADMMGRDLTAMLASSFAHTWLGVMPLDLRSHELPHTTAGSSPPSETQPEPRGPQRG